MLFPAVSFPQIVLAIHIMAVVVGFGVTFAYPLIYAVGDRIDRRGMPWFHNLQAFLGKRLITGGLVVVLAAGIYLAFKLHQWHAFYVQWGLGVTIVLGALGGPYYGPKEEKLAELAQRDVETAGGGEVSWSAEYLALRKQVQTVTLIGPALVLITIYLMSVQAGS